LLVRVGRQAHRRRCRTRRFGENRFLQLTGIDDTGDAQRTPEGAPTLR
jgi:hypothetical protein